MNTKNQSLPDPASRSTAAGNLDAFTLIELAVVIAIIGLLAVMLLPALAGTKGRACAANDISNIKQTMTGMLMYCNENSETLPNPGWMGGGYPWVDTWAASAGIGAILGAHTVASYQKDYDKQASYFCGKGYGTAPALAPPGSSYAPGAQLFQYLKNPNILICPQDTIMNAAHFARPEIITSYVWNGAVVAYQNGQVPFKISRFKPTNILQWENADNGNWSDFSNAPVDYDQNGNLIYSFSTRHGKVALVGRMDGSAGRESMQNMKMWALDTTTKNDLWCSPVSSNNGH